MASNDMRWAGPPVNVTTANENRLCLVPGIGEARARLLLETRRQGPLTQEVLLAMPNFSAIDKLESEHPEYRHRQYWQAVPRRATGIRGVSARVCLTSPAAGKGCASLGPEAVELMAVDTFLRGCKEKLAAVELAVNLVDGAVTNQHCKCPKEKQSFRPQADSPERPQCFNCHEPGHYAMSKSTKATFTGCRVRIPTTRPTPTGWPPTSAEHTIREVELHSTTGATILVDEEALELTNLLSDYRDVFAISDTNLGKFKRIKHRIDTCGTIPIKQRMRRTPLGFVEEEDKHLDRMLKHGIIRQSFSDWASITSGSGRANGRKALSIDAGLFASQFKEFVWWQFPALGQVAIKYMQAIGGRNLLTKMQGKTPRELRDEGLKKAQHSKTKTSTEAAPFFVGSPAQLSRNDTADPLELIDTGTPTVLGGFCDVNMKLKPQKCRLLQQRVPFLGWVVYRNGIEMDSGKVSRVSQSRPAEEMLVELAETAIRFYRISLETPSSPSWPMVWSPNLGGLFFSFPLCWLEASVLQDGVNVLYER
ncbi:hypothetical protein CAPTEDRAFT_210131 [Capitella teleta]|uniref:Uncharacterized protein n=1 Tax=Capitella teleta TaxID=283909 RepID=R7TVJ8_CAPTE|nr:hypothetical protein CAPTEDRAFT_210131 [Capitella teleta]|eukprot:ELT97739.1 hypothetical protein CAPTEDRAFT_210131 [Capitella teleta]